MLLKSDIDSAADELWYQSVLNERNVDLGDFRNWLELNAEIHSGTE